MSQFGAPLYSRNAGDAPSAPPFCREARGCGGTQAAAPVPCRSGEPGAVELTRAAATEPERAHGSPTPRPPP